MDRIVLSTVVYRPPETVFPYLRALERYPRYADHLQSVRRSGDGGPGTRYDLRFAWWKLNYTAHSEVTAVEAPSRLEWRLTADVDARGEWRVEPVLDGAEDGGGLEGDGEADADAGADAKGETEAASRIYFEARYDPHSADPDAISLPRFVSLDWVIRKLRPRLLEEAERVVGQLVRDI